MPKIKTFLRLCRTPRVLLATILDQECMRWLPDKAYLELRYYALTGKALNFSNPRSFNEKIQWQKLYDRRPEYTTMADKYRVRPYVSNIIGEKYLVKLYGMWERAQDIDFDALPKQFVLKCNHDCGSIVICQDKSSLNREAVIAKLDRRLNSNYYWHSREWPYKDIKPCIIAEEYIVDGNRVSPKDYKIYCFNGRPRLIVVFHDRFSTDRKKSETVYDTEWNIQPYSLDKDFPINPTYEDKPSCLDEMLEVSSKLCRGFAQVRTDFYVVGGRILFGEITLHTASGLQPMIPPEMDDILGEWIDLSYAKR